MRETTLKKREFVNKHMFFVETCFFFEGFYEYRMHTLYGSIDKTCCFTVFLLLNKRNAKKQVSDDFLEHFCLGRRRMKVCKIVGLLRLQSIHRKISIHQNCQDNLLILFVHFR